MEHSIKGRFPRVSQSKGKQVLSFYHDCVLRVFENHASRKSEYLGNLLLSTARSGDFVKLCKTLENVDLTQVDFNVKERNTENTPLIIAAEHEHDKIVSVLLTCGSDVTLRNAAGQTVLDNAPRKVSDIVLEAVNRQGASQALLWQAAWQGNASVVKKLLNLNPNLNVNKANSEGFTPLLLVTRDLHFFEKIKLEAFPEHYNPTEVVAVLLHQHADCSAVDIKGRSALHLTARNHGKNARNIISLLARKDSFNVDLCDTQKYSALHCASETADPNVMLALLDNGADVNARGPLGRTPLHLTALQGDERASRILVEHGANVLLLDDLGFTPGDVAKGSKVQYLLKGKKSTKIPQRRSQSSEEQTPPKSSSGVPCRSQSFSSGLLPRSTLDPLRGHSGLRQADCSDSKSKTTEKVQHSIAKVNVLNIHLKGRHFHRHKSCGELPVSRHRVQKFSTTRSSSETLVEPLINPLSLRGRSLSAVTLRSLETLPGIMPQEKDNVDEAEQSPILPSSPVTDNEIPDSPNTDVLNKTFNSKDKPVFWLPSTNSAPKEQNSDRSFFVDWNTLETPMETCTKCREEFKPADFKPCRTLCPSCCKISKRNNVMWFPFGNDDRGVETRTHPAAVDDKTVSIDKKALDILKQPTSSEQSFSLDGTSKKDRCFKDLRKTVSNSSDVGEAFDKCNTPNDDAVPVNEFTLDKTAREEASTFEPAIKRQEQDLNKDDKLVTPNSSMNRVSSEKLMKEQAKNFKEYFEQKENDCQLELEINELDEVFEQNSEQMNIAPESSEHSKTAEKHSKYVRTVLNESKQMETAQESSEQARTALKSLEQISAALNVSEHKDATQDSSELTENLGKDIQHDLNIVSMENLIATGDLEKFMSFANERDTSFKQKLEQTILSINDSDLIQRDDKIAGEKLEPGMRNHGNMRANTLTKDENVHFEIPIEHMSTDVSSEHQIVIVNPFPSPVPPKVPIVNITSNCQCDRFSLVKNYGTGYKKERVKKTGTRGYKSSVNSSARGKTRKTSGIKTVSKSKKMLGQKEKDLKRVSCVRKKEKRKTKDFQNVKEISVIQPNLKVDLIEENNERIPRESHQSNQITVEFSRQSTFVKKEFTALSPILEMSRSCSSIVDSISDISPSNPESTSNVSIRPEVAHPISKNTSNHRKAENDGSVKDSRSVTSESIGSASELDDDLEVLIQEILDETDYIEKHSPRCRNDKLDSKTEKPITNPDIDSKVSTWLEQLAQHCKCSDYNRSFSEESRNTSELRKSSAHHRDSLERSRVAPLDTNVADASYGSGASTPHLDLCLDYSTISGDPTRMDFGRVDVIPRMKLGTSLETEKSKNSDQHSEESTSCSLTISLRSNSSVSNAPVFGDSRRIVVDGISLDGESNNEGLVTSRLSRHKAETSGASSEMTGSEEEEIIWRKGNMLGKGAFGKVYCGLTITGQMIAVKQVELITSNMHQAEKQYQKLQEEVTLLKSLRHENIVSFLGTCLDGGVVNIFMQFVPGGSIASILARFGPLEEPVFRYYTKQILIGVEYLHTNNVVHRDIKGGNIMLMPTGVIKLIDFGCAKRLCMNMSQSQGDLLRSMKGTPYWMAPEVIKETGYGRKSDIWSVGCTVIEMATGKPPWSHLPPMSAILAIGQGSEPPKLQKPSSDDACDFVTITMASNPNDRWSAEKLLRHSFILKCDGQR